MAVLNKIRQRSVFLIIIIALALFSFVLADVIRSGGFSDQKSQRTVGTVNGDDIDREQFARRMDYYQQNVGANVSTTQAVNAVWDQMVRELLIEDQIEELGIRAEEAQIKQMLRERLQGNPTFSNEAGQFDENRLQEYVANLQATSPAAYQQWLDTEEAMAQSARERIYFNMVMAGMGATLKEGERQYRMESDRVDMDFVQIPYTSVPDNEVEVSKSEIRDYMQAHKSRFQVEASRDLQYVYFEQEASDEDIAEVEENISGLLEDRVQFNSVTNSNDTIAGFRSSNDAERFVNENSDEKYRDRFVFRDDLPSEHANEIYNLEVGEVYGPYRHNNAWKATKMLETRQMPDSAKASHILISFQGSPADDGLNRTKEEAQNLADSLLGVIRSDRSKFADLAVEFSADASNRNEGGDLGYFSPGDMVPAFNDFVFENNEGDIDVVETRFGYHIIHIEEQTEEEKAVKVATITQGVEASERSIQELFRETTKFEVAAKDGDFTEAAEEAGYNIKPVEGINANDERIPGIGNQRAIVQWAFNDDSEVGDIKRFDYSGGYVVAQITAENEEGLMSVEDASSTVTPILRNEKKAEIIKNRISGSSLSEIASGNNVSVQRASSVNRANPTLAGAGNEPKVVGAAFGLETGNVSDPIAGRKGVYVIEVINKTEATELPNYRSYAAQQTVRNRETATERILEALKNSADIEDNRENFY